MGHRLSLTSGINDVISVSNIITLQDNTQAFIVKKASNSNTTIVMGNTASGNGYLNINDSGGTTYCSFSTAVYSYIRRADGLVIGSSSNDASAVLNAVSTTKGFLPPRMTTAQRNAIGSPAAGLIVFDTDLQQICVYVTGKWQKVTQTDA